MDAGISFLQTEAYSCFCSVLFSKYWGGLAVKPNLLFVFSDQHRWCDMGCYGNPQVSTPRFDAFSDTAIRFDNCISNSPLCVPARATLFTGLLPLRHGAITNDLPMYDSVTTIAQILAANGYLTGYIGKWHLAGVPRDAHISAGRRRFGFSHWKVCNCSHDYMNAYYYDEADDIHRIDGYEPIAQTNMAIDFINGNKANPWALVLSWGPPHDPYEALPESYRAWYDDKDIELRPNVPDTILHTSSVNYSRDQIKEKIMGYYSHISALDEQFGRLMDALANTGQDQSTIVVYTSDHGDMLGSHGLTNKQLPYDESIRVPLIVRWDGHTRIGVTSELMGLVDLPVSILGLLGLSFESDVDGIDLHTLFTDASALGRDECYIFDLIPCHQAAARGSREWRGLRTRRFTFVRSSLDCGYLLIDNECDPYQMTNLISCPSYDDVRDELLSLLDSYIARHDVLQPWEDFIRGQGQAIVDEWNKSQSYFGMPML